MSKQKTLGVFEKDVFGVLIASKTDIELRELSRMTNLNPTFLFKQIFKLFKRNLVEIKIKGKFPN